MVSHKIQILFSLFLLAILLGTGITPANAVQPGQPECDNTVLSFEDAKRAADVGNAYAQAVVSIYYSVGWKTEKNLELALKYALSSAKAGHPLGIYRVGAALRNGDGTAKDEQQGLTLQQKSFDGLNKMGGNPYAITSLGVMVFQGKVVLENKKEAARLYKIAADMGYAPAQFNYATCAESGFGMAKDLDIRDKYLKKAVLNDYTLAEKHYKATFQVIEKELDFPPMNPEIGNAKLNPATNIWERSSMEGKSSDWALLIEDSLTNPIKAEVRTQYNDYPRQPHIESDEIKDCIMRSGAPGDMQSSGQYIVGISDAENVQIVPTVPMREKNLWGLTEYPLILEFQFTNTSNIEQHLESLTLNIEKRTQIAENIMGLTPAASPGELKFHPHNFGWADWDSYAFEAALAIYHFGMKQHMTLQSYTPVKLEKGSEYEIKTDFDIELRSRFLVAREPDKQVSDSKLGTTRAYSISEGVGTHYSHVRYKSDFMLPENRSGYSLNYPINESIPAGTKKTFKISLDSQKSAEIKVKPTILISNKDIPESKTLTLRIETLCPDDKHLPTSYIPSFGEEAAGFLSYQLDILSGFPDKKPLGRDFYFGFFSYDHANKQERGFQTDELTTADKRGLSKMNEQMCVFVDFMEKDTCLLPKAFRLDSAQAFSPAEQSVAAFTLNDAISVSYSGILRGECLEGSIDIIDSRTGLTAYRSPWAIEAGRANAKMSIQCVSPPSSSWIAWLGELDGIRRLYIHFPAYSSLCYTLPFLNEQTITAIGLDSSKRKLLIQTDEKKILEASFPALQISRLLTMSKSGATVSPCASDVDPLGRIRLLIPIRQNQSQVFQKTDISINDISFRKSDKIVSTTWLSDSRLGFQYGEETHIWDLIRGTIFKTTRPDRSANNAAKNSRIVLKPSEIGREAILHNKDSSAVIFTQWRHNKSPFTRGVGICKKRIRNDNLDPYIYIETLLPYADEQYVSKADVFSDYIAVSNKQNTVAFIENSGKEAWVVDLKTGTQIARVIPSSKDPTICTLLTPDGYYLSGNGFADGCVFSNGTSALPLFRLETQFNRPDIILERMGADISVVAEAKRLRSRFVKRSDFETLGKASIIDVPVVTIIQDSSLRTADKKYSLSYHAINSAGPLREMRIYNNGALVTTYPLARPDGDLTREAHGKLLIDLKSGENLLQLVAVSNEGVTSQLSATTVVCESPPESKNAYIVCVGLSDYQNKQFNLKYAAKDAADMAEALEKAARSRGLDPKVLLLRNEEVTPDVIQTIRTFLASGTPDDEVTLFFAGHGLLDKDLGYQFATYNTDFSATENQGIPFELIESLVEGIKPLRRTVLLDTCHSGEVEEESKPELLAMIGGQTAATPADVSGIKKTDIATRGMKINEVAPKLRHSDFVQLERLFPDSRRAKGANILTSSSGSEFSMESDAWKNGLFTYAFLNALKDPKTDINGDANVTFEEVATTVSDRVSALSGGSQRPITRGVNREVPCIMVQAASSSGNVQ